MYLKNYADIRIGLLDADFWIVSYGSFESIGTPVRVYDPRNIGLKLYDNKTFHVEEIFEIIRFFHQSGLWRRLAISKTPKIYVCDVAYMPLMRSKYFIKGDEL